MNNNTGKKVSLKSVFIVIAVIVLIIIGIKVICRQECVIYGCDNEAVDGSKYCSLHNMSRYYNGNPDNNKVYSHDTESQSASTNTTTVFTKSSVADTKSSYSYKQHTKKSESTVQSQEGYDEGYDDVYMDGEPDWDKYRENDDYARGADDAMDDYDEYGEDW